MAQEGAIAVPSSGPANVRTLLVTTVQGGEPVTVQMQVLSITDEWGNVINSFSDAALLRELLEEVRAMRHGVEGFLGVRLRTDPQLVER